MVVISSRLSDEKVVVRVSSLSCKYRTIGPKQIWSFIWISIFRGYFWAFHFFKYVNFGEISQWDSKWNEFLSEQAFFWSQDCFQNIQEGWQNRIFGALEQSHIIVASWPFAKVIPQRENHFGKRKAFYNTQRLCSKAQKILFCPPKYSYNYWIK